MAKNSNSVSIEAIAMLATPKVAHSDENIEKIYQKILQKMVKAQRDYVFYSTVAENEHTTNEKTSFGIKSTEELIEEQQKKENKALAERQKKFLKSLEKAQLRVFNKTIGVCFCADCKGEKLIALERMLATPNTTMCPEGKRLKAIAEGKRGVYIEDY